MGLATAALGIFPLLHLAAAVSRRGVLSAPFSGLLKREQWILSLLLALTPLWFGLCRLALRKGLPDRLAAWRWHRVAIACATAAATFFVQGRLFDHLPHMTDAITHVFQARLLCEGRMVAPVPPCPEAFRQPNMLMTTDGRWFSKYPPGQALVYAAAIKAGLLRWAGPLTSAAAALCLMRLLARVAGPGAGMAGGILFLVSPMALLLGASYMTHSLFLLCILAAILALVEGLHAGTAVRSRILFACAGLALGYAALLRPPDLAVALLVMAAGWLAWVRQPVSSLLRVLPWGAAGVAPAFLLLSWWNHAIYGNWLSVGYGVTSVATLFPPYQGRFGFHEGFTPWNGLRQTLWMIYRFDGSLLGWPTSLLPVVLLGALAGNRRILLVSLVAAAVTAGTFLPYDYYGEEFEGRYYFALVPVALLLAALGLKSLAGRGDGEARGGLAFALALLLVCQLYALAAYWPLVIMPRYGHDYEGMSAGFAEAAHAQIEGPAVVLIEGSDKSGVGANTAFAFNDPFLTNRILFAMSTPGAATKLAEGFPGRRLLEGRRDGGGSFRFEPPAARPPAPAGP